MPRYRSGWDEEKWRERATFHLAPIQPAYQLSVELFQRQFIFRYFKNSFEGDFHSVAAAPRLQPPPSAPVLPPSHVAPDVSQSPFLGSQHSFDLILRAICNPLQDTEARSPAHHTSLSHSLSAFFSLCSLWTLPFLSSSLSAAPHSHPHTHPATPRLCHHAVRLSTHLMHTGIMESQSNKDLLQVFIAIDLQPQRYLKCTYVQHCFYVWLISHVSLNTQKTNILWFRCISSFSCVIERHIKGIAIHVFNLCGNLPK